MRSGLPAFTVVGLADAAVREARARIQTAVRNAGLDWPARRITANLAPGDLRKAGPGLDLAIACAILAATGQVPAERLHTFALFGELGLDGSVRPAQGTLAVASAVARAGLDGLGVAPDRATEAALVADLQVAPLADIAAAVRFLCGEAPAPVAPLAPPLASPARRARAPDLGDVRGQPEAVRALLIAAAGAHNLLLSGPPGVGKTMLARRLPGIMPPLDREEAIERARIESLLGSRILAVPHERPFRAPHHSITTAGLLGGAGTGWAGEVVLAHRGVLFLDELSEFSRPALDALRQPLEDGCVAISRARRTVLHATRFMLVCATNPCPCGFGHEPARCSCSPIELARHRRRLNGPLLDRVDLQILLADAPTEGAVAIGSARARELLGAARERQAARLAGEGLRLNAEMDAGALARHVRLGTREARLLASARDHGLLSSRGEARVLKVARTIADLGARERVSTEDVSCALALRCEPAPAARSAA